MVFRDMKKRGQAALEFLTTYGWAILVVLVMIAALSSFGVLNPDTLLPERCNVDPSFNCVEHQVVRGEGSGESSVSIILTNQVGSTIDEINGTIRDGPTGAEDGTCDLRDEGDAPIDGGESIYLECTGLDNDEWSPVGAKESFDIRVEYDVQGREFDRDTVVSLYATVQGE